MHTIRVSWCVWGVEFAETLFEQMIDEQLRQWLEDGKRSEGELVEPDIPMDKLMEELQKRLEEQTERHDGGSRWVGTGGRSPFGHSGRASHGVRVGGKSENRSAISVATERKWQAYRTDKRLDSRDLQVVLKQLRQLTPTRIGNSMYRPPSERLSPMVEKSSWIFNESVKTGCMLFYYWIREGRWSPM